MYCAHKSKTVIMSLQKAQHGKTEWGSGGRGQTGNNITNSGRDVREAGWVCHVTG